MSFLSRFLRRNIVADDPQPADLSNLDRLDGVKRRPAVRPAIRPAPESLEEALSDDLLAVARGAGVVRESLSPAESAATAAAMRHFRETGGLDGALRIYATRNAS